MCVCVGWVELKCCVVAFKCVWEHMHVSASLVLTNSIQPSGASSPVCHLPSRRRSAERDVANRV